MWRYGNDDIGGDNSLYGFLMSLLTLVRDLHATEPKDKVFGMLGLTQWSFWREPIPPGLTPDYGRSMKDICVGTTRVIIVENEGLKVLQEAQKFSGPEDGHWPSWVCSSATVFAIHWMQC